MGEVFSDMKKILIWESLGILAGGQKVALQIATALSKEYSCLFLVPEKGPLTDRLKEMNIRYYVLDIGTYSIGEKRLGDVVTYLKKAPGVFVEAYRIIKKEDVALLYINSARNFVWSTLLGLMFQIPVIWHVHNFFHDKKTKTLLSLVGKISSVKRIVFVSNAVKDQFGEFGGKTEVVYNSIDKKGFHPRENGESIREEFNIPDARKLIVTIGWIMPTKNQKVFVKSIPNVLRENLNVHFLVVGGKREGHEDYYEELKLLVENLGFSDFITFTGHRNDVPMILSECYANVITSEEAFPFTLLEGWANGTPTLGPIAGAIPELFSNEENGLLYQYDNAESLAKNLLRLLNNGSLHERLRQRSLSTVSDYNTVIFEEKIMKLIEGVL